MPETPELLPTQIVDIDTIKLWDHNPRINEPSVPEVMKSIQEFGFLGVIVVGSDMVVKAGNTRVKALRKLGYKQVRVLVADHLTEEQLTAFALADNKTGEIAQWDLLQVSRLVTMEKLKEIPGFDKKEVAKIKAFVSKTNAQTPVTEPDPASILTADMVKRGEVWILGKHRIMCGDCTDARDVEKLFDGARPSLVVTDPPYCSGGFQEAGKSVGSIGTKRIGNDGAEYTPEIINDKLSTTGYKSLLKLALTNSRADFAYVFTDWRMWNHLFEVVEGCGYGVRNMIVWDKGSPGMGNGWRTQHELVLYGTKGNVEYNKYKVHANVMAYGRTGNPLHPTQKPVELVRAILDVMDMAPTVYDPFGGSGTTIMACEAENRQAFTMELSPEFCAIAVDRWQRSTGLKAERA